MTEVDDQFGSQLVILTDFSNILIKTKINLDHIKKTTKKRQVPVGFELIIRLSD